MKEIKKILLYSLGYSFIFGSFTLANIDIKWWQFIMITIGGVIISLVNLIFSHD